MNAHQLFIKQQTADRDLNKNKNTKKKQQHAKNHRQMKWWAKRARGRERDMVKEYGFHLCTVTGYPYQPSFIKPTANNSQHMHITVITVCWPVFLCASSWCVVTLTKKNFSN